MVDPTNDTYYSTTRHVDDETATVTCIEVVIVDKDSSLSLASTQRDLVDLVRVITIFVSCVSIDIVIRGYAVRAFYKCPDNHDESCVWRISSCLIRVKLGIDACSVPFAADLVL